LWVRRDGQLVRLTAEPNRRSSGFSGLGRCHPDTTLACLLCCTANQRSRYSWWEVPKLYDYHSRRCRACTWIHLSTRTHDRRRSLNTRIHPTLPIAPSLYAGITSTTEATLTWCLSTISACMLSDKPISGHGMKSSIIETREWLNRMPILLIAVQEFELSWKSTGRSLLHT